MPEDEVIVSRWGDVKTGSCCRVIGNEIFLEYWGPNGHTAEGFMIQAEDLEDAQTENGKVIVMARHFRTWSARTPDDWFYRSVMHPVEVPAAALVLLFGERLPIHLRPPAERSP